MRKRGHLPPCRCELDTIPGIYLDPLAALKVGQYILNQRTVSPECRAVAVSR